MFEPDTPERCLGTAAPCQPAEAISARPGRPGGKASAGQFSHHQDSGTGSGHAPPLAKTPAGAAARSVVLRSIARIAKLCND